MDNFPCFKVVKRDIEKCEVEIQFIDNVMQSSCSVYFLDRRNDYDVERITERYKTPLTLTSIKLELTPSNMTKYYYSLIGLETILYNLFRNDNKPFQEDLKKGE